VRRDAPPPAAGLTRDLDALRRYLWLPIASLAIAIVAALLIGAVRPGGEEARFRMNVMVEATPPLFGPAVLPSPLDYVRLATDDPVIDDVAESTGVSAESLRPRLRAELRPQSPEIEFRVTGAHALTVAREWHDAFDAAVAERSPDLQRELTQPYARQLDEARAQLYRAAAASGTRPDDPVAQQQLAAALANYETAEKLSQSYEVVARTMTATAFSVVAPHERGAGTGSTAGRLAAAVAIGLIAGVAGALMLDYVVRLRRAPAVPSAPARELLDARPALRRRWEHRSGSVR